MKKRSALSYSFGKNQNDRLYLVGKNKGSGTIPACGGSVNCYNDFGKPFGSMEVS